MSETHIEGSVEWFTIPGREPEEDCQCARCGSSCVFIDCSNCVDGVIDNSDRWEWPTIDPCDWCNGQGGWWQCCSGEEWCTANPMPGREDITSLSGASE